MAIDEAKKAEIKGSLSVHLLVTLFYIWLWIAKLEERDNHIRESWVKAMEVRLVRDEVEKCQKAEGVNHYENCKWLVDKYLDKLRDNRVR